MGKDRTPILASYRSQNKFQNIQMETTFSNFANSIETESAFDVLAVAKSLIARGKDVIELEIGDSPFPSSTSAAPAAQKAIDEGHTRYGTIGWADSFSSSGCRLREPGVWL